MSSKKRSLALADAIAAGVREAAAAGGEAAPKRRAYAATRESLLQDLGDGRLQNGKIRLIDPAQCRMWAGHNRLYDLLDKESCGSLIDSIKALGRQEMPAIVRPLKDDSQGFEYEVICGARRHFAVSWLRREEHRTDIRYLVDVRDLSDEEAFRISDAENRDREDISDYERSRDYGRALETYYQGNKSLMAERIGVDRTWLSRFVRIAELPEAVVGAYGDPRLLGIKHAAEIFPLMSKAEKAVLREAESLSVRQASRRKAGEALIPPRAVLAALKRAAEGGAAKTAPVERKDARGKTLFRLEDKARSVVVTIPKARLEALEEVLAALGEELG
jgi:ParB family chromosome partitioning protein